MSVSSEFTLPQHSEAFMAEVIAQVASNPDKRLPPYNRY
jgi:hypothetical protein